MSEDSTQANDCCIKCCKPATKKDRLQSLRADGLNTVLEYSVATKNDDLNKKIKDLRSENKPIKIHRSCQRDVSNKKRKSVLNPTSASISKVQCTETRSKSSKFNWKTSCIFCEQVCANDNRHPDRSR